MNKLLSSTLLAAALSMNVNAATTPIQLLAGVEAGIDTDTGDNLHLLAGGNTVLTTTVSGKIGIGTTSPDVDLEVRDAGSSYLRVTSTDGSQIGIDLVRASESLADFRIANNGGILEFQRSVDINGSPPIALVGLTAGSFRPSVDGNLDLGISGKRWRNLHLSGSVMQPSDRRLKQEIETIQ